MQKHFEWNEMTMKSNISYVTYGNNEKEIVKKGIAAIREVLMGSDSDKKRSLLFALDWFMDPYYGQDIYISDIRDELVELLQTVIISSNDDEVADDALDLLMSYEWPPFAILEKNMDKISEKLKPDVLYAINMGKNDGV